MIKISESSDLDAFKIRQILEKNDIEVFVNNKKTLNIIPSVTSAGGSFTVQLKVKENDYSKAKKLLDKQYKKEKLIGSYTPQHLEQIKNLDHYIRTNSTGTLKTLAKKMYVSQRQICIQLNFLKYLNAKIKYSKKLNSYCYIQPFELLFQFSVLSITDEDIVELYCSSEEKTKVVFKNKQEYL